MCGIFGSTSFSTYADLYKKNCARGNFAYGHLFVGCKDIYIKKREGVTNLSDDFSKEDEYHTFLGHTQAPTSSNRQFHTRTSHPFDTGNFIVAHNGVLENHEKLAKQYLRRVPISNVDSEYIPALLSESYDGDDVNTISETMSEIEGTFGCWIFSKRTRQSYIVRSGSTIYGNINNGNFSSIIAGDCNVELREGIIYCMTREGLTQVGNFKINSQFFI